MKIQTKFLSGIEVDKQLIIILSKYIEDGFYSKNNYLPVTSKALAQNNTILFPNINSAQYKVLIAAGSIDLFSDIYVNNQKVIKANNFLDKVIKSNSIQLNPYNLKRIQSEWLKIQESFFEIFKEMFVLKNMSIKLNIYISPYGGDCYFRKLVLHNCLYFHIWINKVRDISEIAEGIISSYFRDIQDKEGLSWSESEATSDFLLHHTKLKKLFKKYKGTLQNVRTFQKDIEAIKSSKEFLNRIKYSDTTELEILETNIYINGHLAAYPFTLSETKILKLLLDKKKKICSYSNIAEIIWNDSDSFSIWAISRLIYKIRNKLRQNGLSSDKLKTYRGKGFVLDI